MSHHHEKGFLDKYWQFFVAGLGITFAFIMALSPVGQNICSK